MIALLTPIFQGEWRQYGESLVHSPTIPTDAIQVSQLIQVPALLKHLVQLHAKKWETEDLRPAASAWSCSYLDALLPAVATAASLLQHFFPASADDIAVRFNHQAQDGTTKDFHIRSLGTSLAGNNTLKRYDALLNNHLAPLFEQLHQQCGVAKKILWGNVARYLDNLFREAGDLVKGTPAASILRQDREELLCHPQWSDGRTNPLYTRRRDVQITRNGCTESLTLHRQCCLYYLLPGEGYCGGCPLDPVYRKL